MCRTFHSILTVALAVLLVASAVALVAEETVSGTVESVDPQQGRMILRAEEGVDDYTSAKRPTSCKHACNSATSAWYA